MVLRLRGNVLEANYVNYLPHGSPTDLPIAFDLDNTAGAYYEPVTNSFVLVQQSNAICSFESNGFTAEKCVFQNAYIDRANANTMSVEDMSIEFCTVNTFVSNTMETNTSFVQSIDIDMSISNVIKNEEYTVNASLMTDTDINTIFIETANINTSNTNTIFCDKSTIETGSFQSCFNEDVVCKTANVNESIVSTLFVENQDQNSSFTIDHFVDKSFINRADCAVGYIDSATANLSHVVNLTCGLSTTNNAKFSALEIGMCEVSENVHISGDIYTFGNVDYFDSIAVITKPLKINNVGTGPALSIRQETNSNEGILQISAQNPVVKIFNGGFVHFAADSGQDLVGGRKEDFLVKVYGSASIEILITPDFIFNGSASIAEISATSVVTTSSLQTNGQTTFSNGVTSQTTTISGQTSVSSSISAGDLLFQGSRSLNAEFLAIDAALYDLYNSTTSFLAQQSSQLSSQLNGHNGALMSDINNLRSSIQNGASSTTNGLNSYIPPKPPAPAM